jgi:hypothetical protein
MTDYTPIFRNGKRFTVLGLFRPSQPLSKTPYNLPVGSIIALFPLCRTFTGIPEIKPFPTLSVYIILLNNRQNATP